MKSGLVINVIVGKLILMHSHLLYICTNIVEEDLKKIERVSEPIGYPPVYFLNTETTDAFTAPMFELVIQFPIIE